MAGPYVVLRCMGHKSIKLRPGDTVRIGRHHSNDLVLNDGTVSRFHCTIEWDPDEERPWLVDNNSANGVEVDGEEVEGKFLLLGDNQIGVGDFTIVAQLKGAKPLSKRIERSAPATAQALIEDEGETVVRLFSESKRRIKGSFTDAQALERILLQLEDRARTGTLVVRVGGHKTQLVFGQGKLVTIKGYVPEGATGREALKQVLRFPGGSYEFTPDLEPSEEFLDLSVRDFLAEEGDQTMRFQRSPLDE
ncbi:MAG: FHA domain-containing protein [Planctomycetota bacterium]|nr:MAG: FHA domain-containing protein [Planctomycetota bacterium]